MKFAPAVTLVGLPKGMEILYIGRLLDDPNSRHYAIYGSGLDYNFTCVVEEGDGVDQIEVKDVRRYRDGGTTEVDTEIGMFRFPNSMSDDNRQATLDGQPIVWFNART